VFAVAFSEKELKMFQKFYFFVFLSLATFAQGEELELNVHTYDLTLKCPLGWRAQKLTWYQPESGANPQMHPVCLLCGRDLTVDIFKTIQICFDYWNSSLNSTVLLQCDCNNKESVDKNCKTPFDRNLFCSLNHPSF
jgi:hypothetical protein